jgi:TetR/AcrR family transcriptional regulator, mexJK operon transcriptional repressor
MSQAPSRRPPSPARPASAKPAGPGRPKDLGKRAAILDAAKRLFSTQGYDGVSMDQIAAEAGVSKLTVYSHFGDKEALFVEAVKSHCEAQLPPELFEAADAAPLREGLLQIVRAFYAMITGPEALGVHRLMCSPQLSESPMPRLFWDAGPRRLQDAVATVLQHHVDSGELEIDDMHRAASQLLCLAKGEAHAQQVFGCGGELDADALEAHLRATVDVFLRAYAVRAPAP